MTPISNIEKIIISSLFIASAIYQMVYFIRDDRTLNTDPKNRKFSAIWHLTGGIGRLVTCWLLFRAFGWEWGLSAAVILWIWFDGAINTWALNKEWWYVGTTAQTDRLLQWAGKKLHIDPRALNAAIKALAIISVLIILIHKISNYG